MFEQLSIFTEHLFSNTCMRLHVSQTRRQEFPEKVRRLALRVAYLSSRGAILRQVPEALGFWCKILLKLSETDFPKLIFEDFHQIVHQLGF